MDILIGIIIGLFTLLILVTSHEFGHFIMARRSGVKVNEFGIGFPPRLAAWVHVLKKDKNGNIITKPNGKPAYEWKKINKKDWGKSKNGLIFSLNALPIGGFCQMDGESDDDSRPHTFGDANFISKTKILFGGVAINWLMAMIIFTILAWTGIPNLLSNQFSIESDAITDDSRYVEISSIIDNSPASRSGLEAGDVVLSASSKGEKLQFHSAEELIDYNNTNAGTRVTYEISRRVEDKDEIINVDVELNTSENEWGYVLGASIGTGGMMTKRYSWSAPIVGIGTTIQLTGETFGGLGNLVKDLISGAFSQLSFDGSIREAGRETISSAGDSVTGPIGIIGVIFPSVARTGFANTAYIIALISVSLACMNVLPIPALDGGRWLMIAISRLFRKRLSKEREEKIVAISMLVLLGIMAIVTVVDITRFF